MINKTASLWTAIEKELENHRNEDTQGVFPKNFLLAVRASLISGLSCSEICAFLLLLTGVEEMRVRMDDETLLERVKAIIRVMQNV